MNISKLLLSTLFLAACGSDPDVGSLPDATPAQPATRLTVTLGGDKAPILQGASATLSVTIARLDGLAGPVEITAVGLPAGVTADALTIADGATTGTLTLRAPATAPHSLPTQVTVHGTVGTVAADATATVTVYGAPGALDTSFGGGKMMLPGGASDDYAYAAALQADGKLVIAGRAAEHGGDFALIRLDRDGNVDTSFGNGGRVLTDFAGSSETIYALAIQPDGKIVAAGVSTVAGSGNDFALARYNVDGSLDASFGTGGKVTTPVGPDADTGSAVLVQPDGTILVGGDSNRVTTGVDFALARYTSAGALDPSFGTAGIALTPIAQFGARDSIYALARQADGKIVAAGGEGDFTLVRYNADGSLDGGFGTGGKVANLMGSTIGAARAVALAPTGEIVVAGHAQHDVALVRLTSAGALDATFGTGGKVVTRVSTTNWDEAQAVAIEAGGKLVVAGWVYEGGSSAGNFAVLRYDAAGALDAAFGDAGIVITPVAPGTKADQGMAMVLAPDARIPATRIVTAGFASNTNSDFAVARYWR